MSENIERPASRSVLLIVNPRSGRGRAGRIGVELAGALAAAGFDMQRVDLGTPEAAHLVSVGAEATERRAEGEQALGVGGALAAVVVGGDGTVHSCAGLLARARIPVYHVPTGTENLFARQFGMRASAAAVLSAIKSGRTMLVDVGDCAPAPATPAESGEALASGLQAPRPFLVMASVGFDAGVIHRLAAARRGAISHWSYIGPIAREFMQHRAPVFSITVEGRLIVDGVRGVAIVANSRQYARRIDPAHRAEMNDGVLDLVFFPARRSIHVSAWAVLARMRLHHRRRTLVAARGREMILRARDGRAVLQLDGEAVGGGDVTDAAWRFSIRNSALRVLA